VFVEEVDWLYGSFNSDKDSPQPRHCLAQLAMTVLIWFTGTR
jgi:hypothetical protein